MASDSEPEFFRSTPDSCLLHSLHEPGELSQSLSIMTAPQRLSPYYYYYY